MKTDITEKVKAPIQKEEIENIVSDVSEKLNLTETEEIEILFVDKNEITKLNYKHRLIDKPTDVLSFPQQQIPGHQNILGSIVVCPEIVAEKEEEISDVLKHGFLHLASYDHEKNANKWEKAARKIGCDL